LRFYLGTLNAWSQWCNRPINNRRKIMELKVVDFAKPATQELLDIEWASLIMDARTMGLSVEDIRNTLASLQGTSLLRIAD
jgi:hypothetical protein